jgi:hypothetical protein
MAWFYVVRDGKDRMVKSEGGFATQEAAMAAGTEEARRLKSSRLLPGSGLETVTAGQNSEQPTR